MSTVGNYQFFVRVAPALGLILLNLLGLGPDPSPAWGATATESLVAGAEHLDAKRYQEASDCLKEALRLGLDKENEVLAHHHLGNCCERMKLPDQALEQYRIALLLDDEIGSRTGATTPYRKWCFDRIRALRPGAGTLSLTTNPPGAAYELVYVPGEGETAPETPDAEERCRGTTPATTYGLRPGQYRVFAFLQTDKGVLAGWQKLTLGTGEHRTNLQIPLKQACLLYLRTDPPTSNIEVRCENGWKARASAVPVLGPDGKYRVEPVLCPTGTHQVEVSSQGFTPERREVVFKHEGDPAYLPIIRLTKAP